MGERERRLRGCARDDHLRRAEHRVVAQEVLAQVGGDEEPAEEQVVGLVLVRPRRVRRVELPVRRRVLLAVGGVVEEPSATHDRLDHVMVAHGIEAEPARADGDTRNRGGRDHAESHRGQASPSGRGGEEAPVVQEVAADRVRDVVGGEGELLQAEHDGAVGGIDGSVRGGHPPVRDVGTVDLQVHGAPLPAPQYRARVVPVPPRKEHGSFCRHGCAPAPGVGNNGDVAALRRGHGGCTDGRQERVPREDRPHRGGVRAVVRGARPPG